MIHHVHADQIAQPIGRGFGMADFGPRERIHFVHAIIIFQRVAHRVRAEKRAEPIGDKVRAVLANDDAFAQNVFAKCFDRLDDPFGRFGSGNHF
ncbi:MAG: hypothetical protein HDKAJFGB_01295 [Anaerolineae bacterium]|nr:hypothetical protein [Anaerolineae bacterium]